MKSFMKIENENSFVKFEFKESYKNDIAFSLEVFCKGFAGKVDSVWFTEEDVKSFIQQIEQLDVNRKGSAELLEMSAPSNSRELKFKIFSIDNLGHLAISVTLQKFVYMVNGSIETLKTSVTLDIDSSTFSQNIRDFKKLFMI